MGDFNEIPLPSEQKGGIFNSRNAKAFLNMIDACNLLDVTTMCGMYTWHMNFVLSKT